EPEHQPAHRGDGSIWRVNLARLGDESVERFGEYTALHFERPTRASSVRHILADSAAKVVITAPELAAKVEGWGGPIILVAATGTSGSRTSRTCSPPSSARTAI